MKFSLGYWHCKKLERNGEVAYLLEKEVVVETEVLVAAPLDLETDDEEEESLSFLVYNILHCLIGREHNPCGHSNACLCVSFSCFFCLFFGRPLQVKF